MNYSPAKLDGVQVSMHCVVSQTVPERLLELQRHDMMVRENKAYLQPATLTGPDKTQRWYGQDIQNEAFKFPICLVWVKVLLKSRGSTYFHKQHKAAHCQQCSIKSSKKVTWSGWRRAPTAGAAMMHRQSIQTFINEMLLTTKSTTYNHDQQNLMGVPHEISEMAWVFSEVELTL